MTIKQGEANFSYDLTSALDITQTPEYNCFSVGLLENLFATQSVAEVGSLSITQDLNTEGAPPMLHVSTTEPMFEQPFFIQAKSLVGNNKSKAIQGLLTVCGNE